MFLSTLAGFGKNTLYFVFGICSGYVLFFDGTLENLDLSKKSRSAKFVLICSI